MYPAYTLGLDLWLQKELLSQVCRALVRLPWDMKVLGQ